MVITAPHPALMQEWNEMAYAKCLAQSLVHGEFNKPKQGLVNHQLLTSLGKQVKKRSPPRLLSFFHWPPTLRQSWDLELSSLLQSPYLTGHVDTCHWVTGSRFWCWLGLCITREHDAQAPPNSGHQDSLVCQLQRQNLRIFMSLYTPKFCDSQRNPIWDSNSISLSNGWCY